MTKSAPVRQVIIEFICLAIVWVPALIWHLIGKPFQRGFYCDDTSIRYPYKDSTVTDVELVCYSLGVPIILIIIVEIVRWKRNSKWEGIIQQSSSSTTNISSSIRFRSVMIKIVHIVAIFLFGEGCSQLATDIGKYSVGRLRPHFIDVCQPANLTELCPLGGPPVYITDYTCTGTDEKKLLDSRLSFPSGHSSFSAYSMLYLVIYLQCRMNWSGSKLLRPLIQIAALIFSWYTGLSRITDYKHHWSDVLTGFVIGYTAASLTALYIANFFKPKSYGKIPLLAENRNDIELQNHSEVSGQSEMRGFYCDDTSIRYPYKDSTVTSAMLYGYSYCLPIVSIIIVEIVRWKLSSPSQNVSSHNTSSTINISSRIRIPSEVIEIIHLIAIFLFGAACTEWATDFGKYFIGRLRPHFLSVCQPENFFEICPPNGLPIYITNFKCTGKNGQRIQDSRMSFPSGHASFSSYAMLYLVLYLQSRMNWSGSKLLRPTIQIAALMLTWYTGLSRITDYKHHWSDVLTGFLIGSIAASLTMLYVSSLFNRPRSRSNTCGTASGTGRRGTANRNFSEQMITATNCRID